MGVGMIWANNDPCRMKSQTISHESFCDKYYTCVNNQSVVKDCPNGLVYTGLLNQICDFAHNVDCSGREKRSMMSFIQFFRILLAL